MEGGFLVSPMGPSTPVIALESVSKRYGSAPIIHDLSFTVGRGEIVGFLGPNGAGKTTTMRMIAGFTAATSGRVTVAGYDMATENVEAARRIGYLPERPPLYDALGVSAYLRFVARAKGVARTAIPAELERVTAACHLEAVLHHEIYKLSKGYRQRLGLAQALLGSPEVLLLDEPTAGLDPGQIQETREVIRAFGADHAVLLSTHILAEATLICRRVAIINHGRLLAIDSPAGLQRAMEQTNRVALRVTGAAPAAARHAAGGGRGPGGRPARGGGRARRAHRRLPGRRPRRRGGGDRPRGRRPLRSASAGAEPAHAREHLPAVRPGWARERGGGVSGTLAVYRKEMATYFRSPIAYYVVAVFLLGSGYFFLYNIFLSGETAMAGTFQNMGILLMTLAPVISMRLLAAEYNAGTAELLFTLPLTPWQIVVGKFLGAATILLLITAGTTVDLIPLYLFGTPETTTILSGYLGFVLLGLACLAVGQLFSTVTHNQIVAALLSAAVLLAFWFVGHLQSFQASPGLRALVGYLSFSRHFTEFIQGLVRSEGVIFYLVVSAVALTLSVAYLQWRR